MTIAGITWWQDDPGLLEAELASVATQFPSLHWVPDGAGMLQGPIPMWPFEREAPNDLDALFASDSTDIQVRYSHAHPAVPPSIFPLGVDVPIEMRTQTAYHVLADGSLCLLQSAEQWNTQSSTADLVLKAAGWRIEFELLLSGVLTTSLTENGIVNDSVHDHLVAQVIAERLENAG